MIIIIMIINDIYWTFTASRHCAEPFVGIILLNLILALSGKQCYSPHLLAEQAEAQIG